MSKSSPKLGIPNLHIFDIRNSINQIILNLYALLIDIWKLYRDTDIWKTKRKSIYLPTQTNGERIIFGHIP